MKTLFVLLSLVFVISLPIRSQTMIEMLHPEQADIVLLEVKDSTIADVIVYKTKVAKYAEAWNLHWKFKKWGFANFAVYIANDPNDSNLIDCESGFIYHIDAKVYFTTNCEETRYRNPSFHIDGLMKISKKLYM